MKVGALLLAAGNSERFGQDKLMLNLAGKPVWLWSFERLVEHPQVDEVVVVVSPQNYEGILQVVAGRANVVLGGNDRKSSSLAGLRALSDEIECVLIHDAARPMVTDALIRSVIEGVGKSRAATPGLPVTDTIKHRTDGVVVTLDRASLIAVQTPQGAMKQDLIRAHEQAEETATDDMSMLERVGIYPIIVTGDPRNVKLTTPSDFAKCQQSFGLPEVRTGLGYDIHAFSTDPDRRMILGGTEFDDRPGLDGHSDADALLHAIVDALLGAAGLGDIGQLYPNNDPQWKDCSSLFFLEKTGQALEEQGWQIVHIDSSVLAERPKVMARRHDICNAISRALRIDSDRVSVKATTNEKLGAIGRGEGIAAFAVATIQRFGKEEPQQWK